MYMKLFNIFSLPLVGIFLLNSFSIECRISRNKLRRAASQQWSSNAPTNFDEGRVIIQNTEAIHENIALAQTESEENAASQEVHSKPTSPVYPNSVINDESGDENNIEVHLENTDLSNLLKWIGDTFKVNFLTEDTVQPIPQGGKSTAGNKVSFQTNKPLNKRQLWDLFLTFLDLFGFGLIETSIPDTYKLRPIANNAPNNVNRSPLPSYINIDWQELPTNDSYIRYVYFVRNSSLGTIQSVVDQFKGLNAVLKPLQDLNAFILTDKSSNIRSIMQVVTELDQVSSPEAMSVLKLLNADAEDIVKLYENLTKAEDPGGLAARLLGTKKKPSAVYFSDTTRLIAERRTNTLIILGDAAGIKKVEEFIVNYVDIALKVPYSPLHVYELQYANAKDMATILSNVTKFAQSTPAAQAGGVREGDKYLQNMTFTPEESGNTLVVKAEQEDYLKVRSIIKELDVKQPQVVIEVLIVNVNSTDNRELGVQIRNPQPNTISKNLDFQASGLPLGDGTKAPPEINPSTGSLVANLITLASNQQPGATLLSISNSATGVWGLFKILQSRVHANVVSNPFLVTTNKYKAEVSIGETRRVITTSVTGSGENADGFGDITANLVVSITPQINSVGIINLDILIRMDTFTDADATNANRDTKTIKTNANVGNREVLALGGLLKTNHDENTSQVPVLSEIPILGWLFKNKTKFKHKDNLLVFISPRVVEPREKGGISAYSQEKSTFAKESLRELRHPMEKRDPIHRWFFQDQINEHTSHVDNFVAQINPCREPLNIPASLQCPEYCDSTVLVENATNTEEVEAPLIAQNNNSPQSTAEKSDVFIPARKPKKSLIAMITNEHERTV